MAYLLLHSAQPMQTMILAAFSALIISSASATPNSCSSQSTARKPRSLIELFTSEGCSSCPPADRWLSEQRKSIERGDFSAIAWHVDYWDQLGWKDPFSIGAASRRQRWLAGKSETQVYTPGVFLDGREWARWSASAMPNRVPSSSPNLALKVERRNGKLQARTEVSALAENSTLVLVTQLLGRDSQVTRGENSGRLLRHDFSASEVLELALSASVGTQTQTLDLAWPAGSSAVTAFVQNPQGAILQSTQIFLDGCTLE
jgi:hypothetical protein